MVDVLVGMFTHETNTFTALRTDRSTLRARGEYSGAELIDEFRDTHTEIGGVVDVAERAGVELVPTIAVDGGAGGTITRDAYEYYTDRIVAGASEHADEIDGILLALHGAMVPDGMDDGEGPLISRVRDAIGEDVPIVVTLDPHGNVSDEMVSTADALVSYETNPHLDKGATGRRGMELLLETIRGDLDPVMCVERPPVLPHAMHQNTNQSPMADVMARARELEERDGVRKVNVLAGFHRADVPAMGFSVPVVGDGDRAAARAAAREIAALVWERRREFVGDYPTPVEAVARAADLAATRGPEEGPIVLGDCGPQPGGGGTADGTPVLQELLEQSVENAGYAIMCDPDAVEACIDAGVGEHVTVTIGGKVDDRHGEPIRDVTGYVKAITDGTFVNTGTSHTGTGTTTRLGRTVLFQCGEGEEVNVVLTERRGWPFDRELWRHVGVQPERLDVIVITSTTAFRGDYEPIASHIIEVDSPGVSSPFPERFEFSRVQRPKFPLDDMADDAYPDWE